MDQNNIGLVEYNSFLEILEITHVSKPKVTVPDNFNWEEKIVKKLKNWICSSQITVEEAFKSFDHDFDGVVSKDDLKWTLINLLQVEEEEIAPTKLERLFKILDFYKTGNIQLSDIRRLIDKENPYETSSFASASRFTQGSDTFSWKCNAIQQIGLALSKNFSSLKDSFEEVSKRMGQIKFNYFKDYIESSNCLIGFNLTKQLMIQLFSELDPHKKGFLTFNDW